MLFIDSSDEAGLIFESKLEVRSDSSLAKVYSDPNKERNFTLIVSRVTPGRPSFKLSFTILGAFR